MTRTHAQDSDQSHHTVNCRQALLDQATAPALDRLTRLATRLLGAPIALICVLDTDHMVVKSCTNTVGPQAMRCEASPARKLCQCVVASGEPLVVADARAHLAAPDLGIAAYIGVPLIAPDGSTLGIFCVIDTEARAWSPDSIDILGDLAASVNTEIELRSDIIRRQQAEHELRESRDQLAVVLQGVAEGIIARDRTGKPVYANENAAKMLGFACVEDLLAIPLDQLQQQLVLLNEFEQVVPPELLPVQRALRGIQNSEMILRVRMPSTGGDRWLIATATPVFDERGEVKLAITIFRDITDRQRVAQALRDSNTRLMALTHELSRSHGLLRTLFDGMDDALALLDGYGVVLAVNQAMLALLDEQGQQISLNPWAELCSKDGYGLPAQFVLQTLRDGRPRRRRDDYRRADGQCRVLDMQALPLVSADGAVEQVIVHIVDSTEQLQMEALAIQGERLAASAMFAATIAHELNTPLQSLKSCLFLADSASGAPRENYLRLACEELDRVSSILRLLIDQHRPGPGEPTRIDITTLIERVLLLTGGMLAERGIEVVRAIAPDLPAPMGQAAHLTQVLLNLILNAADSMPEGGALHMRAAQRDAAVMIEIADTGIGISPTALPRLFEPFFTTKPQGSGLGLPISQKIIAQHGGRIEVRSTPGAGSCFTIVLPLGGASVD